MAGSDMRQSDKDKQLSPINGGIKDKKCSAGGRNGYLGGNCRVYSRLRFSSVTTAARHTCAVVKPPHVTVRCWGSNINGQVQGPGVDDAPRGLQLYKEPSCMTQHKAKSGPTSCTSCHQNRH